MSKEVLASPSEETKNTEYPGGTVEYSVLGASSDKSPVIIVPGFTESRFVLRDFAETLHEQSGREVIFPDQPVFGKKTKLSALDHHAEALLSIIGFERLSKHPVDFITHSFGSLVAARAAELAKERSITSFDSEKGSHTVFIAPAGSNNKESLLYLGGRWLKFIQREANPTPLFSSLTKELDPTGEMLKAGQKNANANMAKTIEEVLVLVQKERIYKNLGDLGLRPFVFAYAKDVLVPHKVIKTVLEENADRLAGYAVPIDSGGVGADSFQDFKAKTGLFGKEANKAWAHHYRNAGHNDLLFHPERTVKAVLQVLEQ